jgi:hypothetical protein
MKERMIHLLTDYEYGLLYGDGHIQEEMYVFSTTHLEVYDFVHDGVKRENISHRAYIREHKGEDKENWSSLHILEITDLTCVKSLRHSTLQVSPDFLRGYLETKGTLFMFEQRGNISWRCSITGSKEELEFLLFHLPFLSVKKIAQRREREKLGVISSSYRLSINRRQELFELLTYVDTNRDETTLYFAERIDSFYDFHRSKPFNMNHAYKNHKYAAQAMAKRLGYELKGIRGGSGAGSRRKPLYLKKNGEDMAVYYGWEEAYENLCPLFQHETGFLPPVIKKER